MSLISTTLHVMEIKIEQLKHGDTRMRNEQRRVNNNILVAASDAAITL